MGNCMTKLQVAKFKPMSSIDKAKLNQDMGTTMSGSESSTLDLNKNIKHTTFNTKRSYHNEEKATYWMPKDDEEQQRLTGQHFAFKELYDGNLLSSVKKELDFETGISILDIGCGSGVWIMDMIYDYPNCEYHGCDIVDTTNKILKIDQFTFTYGNILKGLPYADNTFDFINMRLFIYALREDQWPSAIEEAIRVVKPGGMFQVTEIYTKLPTDSSSPYYKLVTALRSVAASRGQNPLIAMKLEGMLSSIDNLELIQSDLRSCDLSKSNKSKSLS
ncbi:unnamed protein product [Rhizopus stolonifer]